MNCTACRSLLQQEQDGEEFLAPAALEAHLRACGDCRAFRAGLCRLAEVVRRQPVPAPPADFAARMTACVLADRARPVDPPDSPRPPARWFAALLALAACILVGLSLLGWRWFGSTPVAPNVPVLATRTEQAPVTLRESFREAGSALSALTTRTAGEVAGRTLHLLPTMPTPQLDAMAPLVEPPTQTLTQAGNAVVEGLEPVTNSARRAFDLFLRDVPLVPDANSGL